MATKKLNSVKQKLKDTVKLSAISSPGIKDGTDAPKIKKIGKHNDDSVINDSIIEDSDTDDAEDGSDFDAELDEELDGDIIDVIDDNDAFDINDVSNAFDEIDVKDTAEDYENDMFDGSILTETEIEEDSGFSKKLNFNNFSDIDFYNTVMQKPILTSKYLTRYEKIRAISERICMLSKGAPPTIIDIIGKTNLEIANLELQHKKLPFIIQRKLPNGKIENISVNNLIDINH